MNAARHRRPSRVRRSGFTLIELLVVMAIAVVMMVMAVPSLHSMLAGSTLDRSGQLLGDAILTARQQAVSGNREVEVRFYRLLSGSSSGWRGVQTFRVDQTADGSTLTPTSRLTLIPSGIVISPTPTLSPLLTADAVLQGSTNLPSYGAAEYAGFRYRPDGTVESPVTTVNNFLTLQASTASGNPPANYYTIQINPITGKVILFRP